MINFSMTQVQRKSKLFSILPKLSVEASAFPFKGFHVSIFDSRQPNNQPTNQPLAQSLQSKLKIPYSHMLQQDFLFISHARSRRADNKAFGYQEEQTRHHSLAPPPKKKWEGRANPSCRKGVNKK